MGNTVSRPMRTVDVLDYNIRSGASRSIWIFHSDAKKTGGQAITANLTHLFQDSYSYAPPCVSFKTNEVGYTPFGAPTRKSFDRITIDSKVGGSYRTWYVVGSSRYNLPMARRTPTNLMPIVMDICEQLDSMMYFTVYKNDYSTYWQGAVTFKSTLAMMKIIDQINKY